jgi:hypothetical protein
MSIPRSNVVDYLSSFADARPLTPIRPLTATFRLFVEGNNWITMRPSRHMSTRSKLSSARSGRSAPNSLVGGLANGAHKRTFQNGFDRPPAAAAFERRIQRVDAIVRWNRSAGVS